MTPTKQSDPARRPCRSLLVALLVAALLLGSSAELRAQEPPAETPGGGAGSTEQTPTQEKAPLPGGAFEPMPPRRPPPPPSPGERDDFAEVSVLSLEQLLNQRLESATKTPTPILQIPNRVEVVTEEQIRRRGYRYLIELIEDLPGVQSMNYVEAETGAHVIVRGIWQNNKILVLYDGHKITSPEGKDFIFGRHNWSLANVKRVEFIYGPASALYGADAVSAVINIVPKDFEDLDGHLVEATAGYGLYNTVEADLASGLRGRPAAGPGRRRLSPQRRSESSQSLSGLLRLAAGIPTTFDRADSSTTTAIRSGWRPPSPTTWPCWPTWARTPGSTTCASTARSSRRWGSHPPLFEFSKENMWAWYQDNAGLTHELSLSPSLVLRTLLTYNHQQCDPKTQFINNFFDGGRTFTRADYKMFRSIRLGAAEELVHTSSPFGHRLQLVRALRFEDIYSLTKISTTTGLPAQLRYPLNYQTNDAVPNGEVNFQALGGYFQAQYEALDRLNLVAGVNVDKVWHYKTAFNPRDGATFTPVRAAHPARQRWPRPIWCRRPPTSSRASTTRSFPGMGTIGAIPNTDLVPEDYLTVEGGLTAVLLQQAAAGRSRRLPHRQRQLSTPPAPAGNAHERGLHPGLSPQTAPADRPGHRHLHQRKRGRRCAPTAARSRSPRTSPSGCDPGRSYSLALGRQTETPTRTGVGSSTDYLANQAAHQIKGGVQISPLRRLFLVPSAVWYSRTKMRTDVADPALLSAGLDPFFLLNLSAVWEGDRFQVWARVHNVLDRHYYRPGGPVSQQAAPRVPQSGILGQAGIRVLF